MLKMSEVDLCERREGLQLQSSGGVSVMGGAGKLGGRGGCGQNIGNLGAEGSLI